MQFLQDWKRCCSTPEKKFQYLSLRESPTAAFCSQDPGANRGKPVRICSGRSHLAHTALRCRFRRGADTVRVRVQVPNDPAAWAALFKVGLETGLLTEVLNTFRSEWKVADSSVLLVLAAMVGLGQVRPALCRRHRRCDCRRRCCRCRRRCCRCRRRSRRCCCHCCCCRCSCCCCSRCRWCHRGPHRHRPLPLARLLTRRACRPRASR